VRQGIRSTSCSTRCNSWSMSRTARRASHDTSLCCMPDCLRLLQPPHYVRANCQRVLGDLSCLLLASTHEWLGSRYRIWECSPISNSATVMMLALDSGSALSGLPMMETMSSLLSTEIIVCTDSKRSFWPHVAALQSPGGTSMYSG